MGSFLVRHALSVDALLESHMRWLLDIRSASAPWVSAILASVLYALLARLTGDHSVSSHVLEIIAVGIAAFLGTVAVRRKSVKKSDDAPR